MILEVGKSNSLVIHTTLLPFIKAAGEMKTKPTQHSVMRLREIGLEPDVLVCRTEENHHLTQDTRVSALEFFVSFVLRGISIAHPYLLLEIVRFLHCV